METLSIESFITLGMLILLQALLGFDKNILGNVFGDSYWWNIDDMIVGTNCKFTAKKPNVLSTWFVHPLIIRSNAYY